MKVKNEVLTSEYASTLGEKNEFIAVDFFRLFCAFIVLAGHFLPFREISSAADFWLTQILVRVAVPFFFTTSGFFVYKAMQTKESFSKYIKRAIRLYVIYTCLHLPELVYNWFKSEAPMYKDVLYFIKTFFITGSYVQFWYFASLISASLILYFCLTYLKLKDKQLVIISTIIYCIGVLCDAYKNLFMDLPYFAKVMNTYYSFFETTRNGFFFGFFFLLIGYLMRKHSSKIKNRLKTYTVLMVVTFAAFNAEEYLAKYLTNHEGQTKIFTTPFFIIFLFLTLAFTSIDKIHLPKGLYIRKLSILMYGFHMFLSFYFLGFMSKIFNIHFSNMQHFLVMCPITLVFTVGLIWLQKHKKFNFIKYLY